VKGVVSLLTIYLITYSLTLITWSTPLNRGYSTLYIMIYNINDTSLGEAHIIGSIILPYKKTEIQVILCNIPYK